VTVCSVLPNKRVSMHGLPRETRSRWQLLEACSPGQVAPPRALRAGWRGLPRTHKARAVHPCARRGRGCPPMRSATRASVSVSAGPPRFCLYAFNALAQSPNPHRSREACCVGSVPRNLAEMEWALSPLGCRQAEMTTFQRFTTQGPANRAPLDRKKEGRYTRPQAGSSSVEKRPPVLAV
jgi:hypothetical protein